jgi:hypothetical protein
MTSAAASLRVRLTLGFEAACLTAVALYGVLRCVQSVLFNEPNPATVIWSAHAGYLWRSWTVSYAGVMAGFLAFAAAKKHDLQVARALLWGLYVAGALILLQGLFVP